MLTWLSCFWKWAGSPGARVGKSARRCAVPCSPQTWGVRSLWLFTSFLNINSSRGVGCFCICSAVAHGSALLIMVVLRVSESRTLLAMVPAPKPGMHKLQLIIPLSCHYQLVPSEESWQKWVIRRILEKTDCLCRWGLQRCLMVDGDRAVCKRRGLPNPLE